MWEDLLFWEKGGRVLVRFVFWEVWVDGGWRNRSGKGDMGWVA